MIEITEVLSPLQGLQGECPLVSYWSPYSTNMLRIEAFLSQTPDHCARG